MNMTLTRKQFRGDGIFSTLIAENGGYTANTLEHSYTTQFIPKLQPGVYKCVRGMHRLHGMASDFETFEVTGVVGHSGMLFHVGNYNKDSDGCILLGQRVSQYTKEGLQMVTGSKVAFADFMMLQKGTDLFTLVVI